MAAQPQLSATQLEILGEDGFHNLRTIAHYRDQHGYPSLLIEGEDEHGWLYRAWLREGESINDMRWDERKADGSWPEALCHTSEVQGM